MLRKDVIVHIAALEDFGEDVAHLLAHAQYADRGAGLGFVMTHISFLLHPRAGGGAGMA
jgi:hypothetical protein